MKKRPTMLTANFVTTVNVLGGYGDGRGGLGLTLLVQPSSRQGLCKSWGQSVCIGRRRTTIGLGRYPVVTLARARTVTAQRAVVDHRSRNHRHSGTAPDSMAVDGRDSSAP